MDKGTEHHRKARSAELDCFSSNSCLICAFFSQILTNVASLENDNDGRNVSLDQHQQDDAGVERKL